VAGRAPDRRPSVVAAGHDEIHLVVAAVRERIGWPVFGLVQRAGIRLPGDALNIAMAERPDRRARGGIVGRDRPVLVQPQDLSPEAARVLRVRSVLGVARGDVELPVRTELQPTAVMIVVAGDPIEDDGLLAPQPVLVAHPNDLVACLATRCRVAVIEVDEAVARELRIERDPKETLFAVAAGARRNRGPGIRAKAAARPELHDAHAPN